MNIKNSIRHSHCTTWGMRAVILLMICQLACITVKAQTDSVRVFTTERPLVYEDAWDLWPYVFLNENGEPDGYNIDLLKLIFKELDIPYIVKLKPTPSNTPKRGTSPSASQASPPPSSSNTPTTDWASTLAKSRTKRQVWACRTSREE